MSASLFRFRRQGLQPRGGHSGRRGKVCRCEAGLVEGGGGRFEIGLRRWINKQRIPFRKGLVGHRSLSSP